jgi:RNA polymerase sigma-70 factor (ECF subfamily)
MTCPTKAGGRPGESRRDLPQSQQWDTIQETFLVSRPRFVGLAYCILRNQEDAEDAVQNAMLSAYLHLRSFEGRSAFTTWFTRIVFNAALMIRRKRKPSRLDSFPDFGAADEGAWTDRIPARQADPEMACAEVETFRWIDDLLAKMSPVLRQAFTMVYYDELSIEEACVSLGVTPGTFKSRVFRARQLLIGQTRRSLVAPMRGVTHMLVSSGNRPFAPLSARSSEIQSARVAFG